MRNNPMTELINKQFKVLFAAAIGGAVPVAAQSLQSCGTDPQALAVQMIAGAVVAIGWLFVEKPKQGPPPQPPQKPRPLDDEEPPPDPGPQG